MADQQPHDSAAAPTTQIDTNQQQGASVLGNITASAGNAGRMVAGQVTGQVDSVLKKLHFSDYKSSVLVELFGTFVLTLTTSLAQYSVPQLAPLAIGFMYSSLIFTYHYISGAHFNPAMTLGIWLSRDGPATLVWHKTLLYWIFQILGATLAAFYSLMIYGVDFAVPTTPDSFYPGIFRVLITEAVFTFMLVSVMLHVAHSKQKENSFHGFAVGMMLMAATLANQGGVLNPAIATALIVVKCFTGTCIPVLHLWVFWAGELIGCVFAAIFYNVASATLEEQERQEQLLQQGGAGVAPGAQPIGDQTQNQNQQQQQQQQPGASGQQQQQSSSVRYGDAPQEMSQMQFARNEGAPMSNNNLNNNNNNMNGNKFVQPQGNSNNNFNSNNSSNQSTNFTPSNPGKSTAPPTPSQFQENSNNQQLHHHHHTNSVDNGNSQGNGEDVSPLYQ